MRSATVEERFWAKVSKTAGCWLWTGSKDKKGYGQLRVGKVTSRAHRLAYEMTVGPIPDGLVIDHLCRTPGCVNPSHLEPVTSAENSKRGIPRNRLKTHCAKGHPYTPENTYRDPRGWRQCRACHRERDRQRWITERNSRPAKPRPLPLNCSVCGRFVPARWPYVQTSGGGFTGDPLELVDARCTEHVPPGTAVEVRAKRP